MALNWLSTISQKTGSNQEETGWSQKVTLNFYLSDLKQMLGHSELPLLGSTPKLGHACRCAPKWWSWVISQAITLQHSSSRSPRARSETGSGFQLCQVPPRTCCPRYHLGCSSRFSSSRESQWVWAPWLAPALHLHNLSCFYLTIAWRITAHRVLISSA